MLIEFQIQKAACEYLTIVADFPSYQVRTDKVISRCAFPDLPGILDWKRKGKVWILETKE